MSQNRDKLANEYKEIKEQMMGISPKLSLYKKLEDRLKELDKQLDGVLPNSPRFQEQYRRNGKNTYTSRFHRL